MRRTLVAVGCAGLLLSGCATLIDISKVDGSAAQPYGAEFDPAFARLDNAMGLIQSALKDQIRLDEWSGAGILVGGAGAGISGLFHGSRDLVAGLASFAGVSAAVNSLYGTKTYEFVYIAGEQTLSCVRDKARPLALAFKGISEKIDDTTNKMSDVSAKQQKVFDQMSRVDQGSSEYGDAHTALDDSEKTMKDAWSTVDPVERTELRYVGAMDQAVTSVVFQVNAQIESIRPDASTIAAAAANVSVSAQSTISTSPPTTPKVKPADGSTLMATADFVTSDSSTNPEQSDLRKAIGELKAATQALKDSAEHLANASGLLPAADDTLFAGCAMSDATKAPALTIDPSGDLSMTQNTPVALVVGGGTGAFRRADWADATPPPIKVEVVNGTILRLTPDKTSKDWKDGNTYTLVVTDLGAGHPPPARIKVTTKAKTATPAITQKPTKPKTPPK